jgi:hypothetical protein
MRIWWVALLGLGCSSAEHSVSTSETLDAGVEENDGESGGDGDASSACWEGCKVTRPMWFGACTGIGPGACETTAFWLVNTPACGETGTWIQCKLDGALCVTGQSYESTQICEP